jgi:hypothetical protein
MRVVGTVAVTVTVPKTYLVRCTVDVGDGDVGDCIDVNGTLLVLLVEVVCRLTLLAGSVGGRLGVTVGLVLVTGGRPGRPHSRTLTMVVVDGQAVRVTSYVTVVSYVEVLHA